MYKNCKTVQSAERQKRFAETLLHMMESRLFCNITITALCQEMNAPRKAFYRYFENMEDVLYAAIDSAMQESFLMLTGKVEAVKYFTYWKEHRKLLDLLEKNGMTWLLSDRAYLIGLASARVKDFGIAEIQEACRLTGCITLVALWHHSGMKETPEEIVKIADSIFL